MPKLVPLKCSICGANLSRETLICEYCGTNFVLSEESAAIQQKPKFVLEPETREGITQEVMDEVDEDMYLSAMRWQRESEGFGSLGYNIDDRVSRKILRYLKETTERKIGAIEQKFEEYKLERARLKRLFDSGRIDEDAYEDQRKELWEKYMAARQQLEKILDCGEALKVVFDFILKCGKEKLEVFRDIKSIDIDQLVFKSVDGKASGDSFVYRITGSLDCLVKSGMFSTKQTKKYFSAEVDYKTGKIVSFKWESDDPLNVEEYRGRPLPLPKFL
jgi:hypothetical protein